MVAVLTILLAYFACARISKGFWTPTFVISLSLYALAVTCWALDIRLLWQALYLDLPKLLSSSATTPGDTSRDFSHGPMPFAQEILWVCVVSAY